MRGFVPTLVRNKRLIGLFALTVLVPAFVSSLLILRAIRLEELQLAYDVIQRQQQIARAAEADLTAWLFSEGPNGGRSVASLRFEIAGDQILFPDFQLTLPATETARVRPFEPVPVTATLTAEVVTTQYYPRVQAFLRDAATGRHPGAQHFLRLRALIVRPPGSSRGYVIHVDRVFDHVNARLVELCAQEPFAAAVWVGDAESKLPSSAVTHGLQHFPFFEIAFADVAGRGGVAPQRYAFATVMALLVTVTVLGSVFVHRAVAHDVRLSHMRSQFVAAVSHEFRSPLSSIRALAERLVAQRAIAPDHLAEYHRIIERDAHRLSALVDRLLDFGRLEQGRVTYSLATSDLVAITEEAIAASGYTVNSSRVQFTPPAGPLWVRADPTAVSHAIQNLIDNATKYSPGETPISVRCASINGSHCVEVRDCGIGIPPDEQLKIFEKFYRGRDVGGLSVQGVGIGLALVKQVVDDHGGSVSVVSRPGDGSTFTLHLPRADR